MRVSRRKNSRYTCGELLGKAGELVTEDTPQEIAKNISNIVTHNKNITSQSSATHNTGQGDGKSSSSQTTDNSNKRINDSD